MNDLRFAFRQVLKYPGFTAVVALTLALGMGANVSIFSIFNAATWHPLPGVKSPQELVYAVEPGRIHYLQYEFYHEHARSFSGLAASANGFFRLGAAGPPDDGTVRAPILVRVVAGDYFGVLGAAAPIGRYFLPAEYGEASGAPVVVLSHRFWQEHFQADPAVIGRTLSLEGKAFTIVGVAPETFPGREPSRNFMEPSRRGVDEAPDAWSPLLSRNHQIVFNREAYDFRLFGRFRQGVAREQAEIELEVLDAQFAERSGVKRINPAEAHHFRLVPGFARIPPLNHKDEFRGVGLVTVLLALVLLVACANIANLLMARAADRQREIGVRQALGASRGRLLRQLLTESVLLALLGGLVATLFGHWTMALVRGCAAWGFPEYRSYIENLEFSVDWRVVAYAMGLSLFSGIVFGLVPALDLLRANLAPALKQEGSVIGARLPRASLRNVLIVGQVAVSLCLTIVAGLIVRSIHVASSREFGFASRDVLLVELGLPGYGPDRAQAFHRQLTERLSALPGIQSVALTSIPKGGERTREIVIDGGASQPFNLGFAGVNRFSPGYFETLKIPILHGRGFSAEDVRSDAPVAIVSEAMARRFWPNQNAVGRQFSLGPRAPVLEIVGVAKDAMPANLRNYMPGGQLSWFYSAFAGELYFPLRSEAPDLPVASLVVRVAGKPNAMIPLVTKEVQNLDRDATVSAQTIGEMMDAGLAPFIAGGLAASGLGLLTSVLAMMGIYGVMVYVVRRRTHEVGVRIALGARQRDILALVIGQGMRVVVIGALLGIIAAMGSARLLASKLFGLSPLDPVAFLGVALLSLLAALLACYLPARRASQVDPMEALRYE
jgi:predicted permease